MRKNIESMWEKWFDMEGIEKREKGMNEGGGMRWEK